ncbi:Pkinase-domain-containing protein [Trametes versicolor FP-101664 SS1]|uniref:Pkinase-domain-containing protein n=1 Tax=Trametes versicolor (strain FP-101664) TaxID=717944 RepID=UPI0004623A9A|nr:Pkinase-domain-containing protein [Trametes versicolor FP-101664 SS1]EIW61512.1 Pkinase-domain-containing protein [Trametes versicolor FP-101664 SS1]
MARVQMSAILPDFAGFTLSQGCFHLRLLQRLGNGAYGVVYLAQDLAPRPHGAEYYAVKCVLKHERGSALARQQQREIAHHRAMSEHPNVVTLHAVVEEEFYTFLVLDLCDGGDLFNAIMDRRTFANNTEAVRRMFLQVIDAVEACHASGIYHRDLKPENILCDKDDKNVYLADFGLSTRTRFSANFGCGSSFYMSPECLGIFHKKRPYATAPSDVWALGTILCNVVTGRNPWHVASPKTDAGFRLFLREGAPWLQKSLDISVAASELFARIFTVDPALRITIPELRKAVLAIDSFFPGGAPSSSTLQVIEEETAAEVAELQSPRIPEEADITEQVRPEAPLGHRNESWELRPLALCATISTDFMTMPTEKIAAAATATCVGTESTFVNGGAESYEAFASTDSLDDVWSISGPPPVAASPEQSFGTDSGSESDVPITPDTFAANPDVAVPDLALDGPVPSECDITMACTRLTELKMEKKSTNPVVRLFTGVRMRMRA